MWIWEWLHSPPLSLSHSQLEKRSPLHRAFLPALCTHTSAASPHCRPPAALPAVHNRPFILKELPAPAALRWAPSSEGKSGLLGRSNRKEAGSPCESMLWEVKQQKVQSVVWEQPFGVCGSHPLGLALLWLEQAGWGALGDALCDGSCHILAQHQSPWIQCTPPSLISARSYLGHMGTASILLINQGWEARD